MSNKYMFHHLRYVGKGSLRDDSFAGFYNGANYFR